MRVTGKSAWVHALSIKALIGEGYWEVLAKLLRYPLWCYIYNLPVLMETVEKPASLALLEDGRKENNEPRNGKLS